MQGQQLVALHDQPMRNAPREGASHHRVGVTAGLTVLVEKVYVDKKTGVRRFYVSFTDDKSKTHQGWVREHDAKHRYFELSAAPHESVPPTASSPKAEKAAKPSSSFEVEKGAEANSFEVEKVQRAAAKASEQAQAAQARSVAETRSTAAASTSPGKDSASFRSAFKTAMFQRGDTVDVESEEGWQYGATILGPAIGGNADELQIRFADGDVADWPISDLRWPQQNTRKLGTWTSDIGVQLPKGLTSQGVVLADSELMESCLGAPKETSVKVKSIRSQSGLLTIYGQGTPPFAKHTQGPLAQLRQNPEDR